MRSCPRGEAAEGIRAENCVVGEDQPGVAGGRVWPGCGEMMPLCDLRWARLFDQHSPLYR